MKAIQVDKTKNYIHLFSGGLDSTYQEQAKLEKYT